MPSFGFGRGFSRAIFRRAISGALTNISAAQLNQNVADAGGIALEAYIGASRFAHGVFAVTGQMSKRAAGQWVWASMLRPGVRGPAWYDTGYTQFINFASTNGFYFAQDGTGYAEIITRLDKVIASDAHIVIINSPLSNVGASSILDGAAYSAASYVAIMQFVVDYLLTANSTLPLARRKYVIVDQLWERGSAANGNWTVGNAGRLSVPTVNTLMKAMLDARSIPMIPVRDGITRASDGQVFAGLIDTAGTYTPNCEPMPGITRTNTAVSAPTQVGDGTHLSNTGGKRYGEIKDALYDNLGICPKAQVADPARAGNLMSNAMMTGTAGVIGGTNVAGTLATGYTSARFTGSTTTASAVTLSKVSKVPSNTTLFGSAALTWQQIDIDTSAAASNDREAISITQTVDISGLQNGQYYEASLIVEVDAWDGWRGYNPEWASPSFSNSGRTASTGLTPINDGGSLRSPLDTDVLPFPPEAWTGQMITNPFKANGTTAQFRFSVGWTKASGVGRIRITGVELRLVSNPAVSAANSYPDLLMYDESLPATAAITSSSAFAVNEEENFALQLTANKLGTWSISGTDINAVGTSTAQFAVSNSPPTKGQLTPVAAKLDYEIPTDADGNNIYALTVTFTPFDKRIAAVNQAATITVADVNDGFSDTFNRANGEITSNASWTKVGAGTATVSITSNVAGSVTGTGRAAYLAPQQGNQVDQMISFDQKISASGSGPVMCVSMVDENNWVGVRPSSTSAYVVRQCIAGSETTLATINNYTSYAAGQSYRVTLKRDGQLLTLYCNNVKLGTATLGAGVLTSAVRSGLYAGLQTNAAYLDNWNNRVSAPVAEKIGLLKLVFDETGTASISGLTPGVPGAKSIASKKTVGSVTTVSNIKKGGVVQSDQTSFYADGPDIRWTGIQASGETWTVDVAQSIANAANNNDVTTLTFVFA